MYRSHKPNLHSMISNNFLYRRLEQHATWQWNENIVRIHNLSSEF